MFPSNSRGVSSACVALEAISFKAENSQLGRSLEDTLMSGGGWSCPHEINGTCGKVNNLPCDPGMKGCELYGRYVFFDSKKNERLEQKKARSPTATADKTTGNNEE